MGHISIFYLLIYVSHLLSLSVFLLLSKCLLILNPLSNSPTRFYKPLFVITASSKDFKGSFNINLGVCSTKLAIRLLLFLQVPTTTHHTTHTATLHYTTKLKSSVTKASKNPKGDPSNPRLTWSNARTSNGWLTNRLKANFWPHVFTFRWLILRVTRGCTATTLSRGIWL